MLPGRLALVLGDPAARSTTPAGTRLAPEDEDLDRPVRGALAGLDCGRGDLEAAYPAYTECMRAADARRLRRRHPRMCDRLADIRLTQGRLGEAMRIYEQALRDSWRAGRRGAAGTADMHVG